MAEVRSLQSQLRNVNGRRASGDRIILPLSSMSEVLGAKDGSTFSKTIRNSTSFQESSISIKEELRSQTTSTPVSTVVNSVPESIFVLVMPRAFLACLENVHQYSQSLLPDSSSFSKGRSSSSVTALGDKTSFL